MAILDELNKAKTDLTQRVELQEIMKKSNAVIRNKKLSDEEKINELVSMNLLNSEQAAQVVKPDYTNRKGFQSYKLQNNNAEIKRLKERVKNLESKRQGELEQESSGSAPEWEFDGGTMIANFEADRYQIMFDEIPDAEFRSKLKRGWRWSPRYTAWQRKITPNALYAAKSLLPNLTKVEPAPVEAAAPAIETPTPEITGFKQKWKIEFLNKDKNFKKDTKYFEKLVRAKEWGKGNIPNWNEDMLTMVDEASESEITTLPNTIDSINTMSNDKFAEVLKTEDNLQNLISLARKDNLDVEKAEILKPILLDQAVDIINGIGPSAMDADQKDRDLYNLARDIPQIYGLYMELGKLKEINKVDDNDIFGSFDYARYAELTEDNNHPAASEYLAMYFGSNADLREVKKLNEILDKTNNQNEGRGKIIDERTKVLNGPYAKMLKAVDPKYIEEIDGKYTRKEDVKGERETGDIPTLTNVVIDDQTQPETLRRAIKYSSKAAAEADLKTYREVLPFYFPLKVSGSVDSVRRDIKGNPLETGWYLISQETNVPLTNGWLNKKKADQKDDTSKPAVREDMEDIRKQVFNAVKNKVYATYADNWPAQRRVKREMFKELKTIYPNSSEKQLMSITEELFRDFVVANGDATIYKPDGDADKYWFSKLEFEDGHPIKNLDRNSPKYLQAVQEYYNVKPIEFYIEPEEKEEAPKQYDNWDERFYVLNKYFDERYNQAYYIKAITESNVPNNPLITLHYEDGTERKELATALEYLFENSQHYKRTIYDKMGHPNPEPNLTSFPMEFPTDETKAPDEAAAKKSIVSFDLKAYENQYVLNKAIESFIEERNIELKNNILTGNNDFTIEQKIFLRAYSGYGGLDKFGPTGKGGFTEYYTPKPIIEKMWALAYKYGYNNGSLCETSVGTGEFLQFSKPDLRKLCFEINKYSAIICKILYPTAEVRHQPFEKHFIYKNDTIYNNIEKLEKFDLVIGNCPYGSIEDTGSRYFAMGEKNHVKPKNFTEYFLRRSLDILKPNGLIVMIVGAAVQGGGRMFMDSGPSEVKEYLHQNSNLLTAYRLPDSVFETTSVTSDILVIKKK